LVFVVASFVAAFPAGLINTYWSPSVGFLVYPIITAVLIMWFVRLYQRSTKRIVPLCPH